ncbi:hypothetical protein DBR40_23780 [Pedobacter sp. KBW01]|nr:hypothetical protein DBR40_23780 [Pedobacter sp. KBW01]
MNFCGSKTTFGVFEKKYPFCFLCGFKIWLIQTYWQLCGDDSIIASTNSIIVAVWQSLPKYLYI